MTEIKIESIGNSYIPHEIVFDVLRRVPAESLLRFRCVSKSFCSLISQPSFTEAHQKGSFEHLIVSFPDIESRKTFNIDKRKEDTYQAFSLEYLNEPCFDELVYLESVNGLVCLWNNDEDVAVCNPFTREHVFLPKPTEKVSGRITCCNLGFHPTTNTYKVLKADGDGYPRVKRYSIFTLGRDKSWREIHCGAEFFPLLGNCVSINEVIYCVNLHEFGPNESHDHIAAFNVGEETFRMISFPQGVLLSLSFYSPVIVEIKGELALLVHRECRDDNKILMYVFNGGETWSWVLKDTTELPLEFKNTVTKYLHCRFTSTTKGEIVLIPSFNKLDYVKLMYIFLFLYDIEKREWIKYELCGVGERDFVEVRHSVWRNIVESFTSLK